MTYFIYFSILFPFLHFVCCSNIMLLLEVLNCIVYQDLIKNIKGCAKQELCYIKLLTRNFLSINSFMILWSKQPAFLPHFLPGLYSSPSVLTEIKWRRLRWARYVAHGDHKMQQCDGLEINEKELTVSRITSTYYPELIGLEILWKI